VASPRRLNASMVESHKVLIAATEAKIAELALVSRNPPKRARAAKDRLEKIRGGETAGGLGKRVDLRDMLKSMLTPSQFRSIERKRHEDTLCLAHPANWVPLDHPSICRRARFLRSCSKPPWPLWRRSGRRRVAG